MRGEKTLPCHLQLQDIGSPPHARGKVVTKLIARPGQRITPACAGKRLFIAFMSAAMKDHPRMRGEKRTLSDRDKSIIGSPPHARGKVCFSAFCRQT